MLAFQVYYLFENSFILFLLTYLNIENPVALDESKIIINYYPTENKQYIYDSDLSYLQMAIENEYGEKSQFFNEFIAKLEAIIKLSNNENKMSKALHLGSSTGRISFELAKIFESVSIFILFF